MRTKLSWSNYGPVIVSEFSERAFGSHPCRVVSGLVTADKTYSARLAASIVAFAPFNVACVSRAILPFAIKLRSLAFSVVVE